MAATHLGTYYYMSPEIFEYKEYTNKIDIWSLGCVFYEMLYGKRPFEAKTLIELKQKVFNKEINFENKNCNISDQTIDLIKRMLENSPENRISWIDLYSHPVIVGGKNLLSISRITTRKIKQETFEKGKEIYIKEGKRKIEKKKGENDKTSSDEEKNKYPKNIDEIFQSITENKKLIKDIEKKITFKKNLCSLLAKGLNESQLIITFYGLEHLIVYFVLSKKSYILSENLNDLFLEFKKKYPIFVKDEYYIRIKEEIEEIRKEMKDFYEISYNEMLEIMNKGEFAKKYNDHIKFDINFPGFENFYKECLIHYLINLNDKAQNLSKVKTNEKHARTLISHCFKIIDCINIDKFSTNYRFENHEKNLNKLEKKSFEELINKLKDEIQNIY